MATDEIQRPIRGSTEYDLWMAAIHIATRAPWRQGKHVGSAQIPWTDIHALRASLSALGIDWENVKRSMES